MSAEEQVEEWASEGSDVDDEEGEEEEDLRFVHRWVKDEDDAQWFVYQEGIRRHHIPLGITHVLVEEGVYRVVDYAFSNGFVDCKYDSLVHVKIAASVVAIGENAFACCESLVKLAIPE